jgi:hypothetical protein
MKLSRRPPPRHVELFTTADDLMILPEPHGQKLSNPKKSIPLGVPSSGGSERPRKRGTPNLKIKNGAEKFPRRS